MTWMIASFDKDNRTVIQFDEWLAKRRPEQGPADAEGGLMQAMRGLDLRRATTLASETLGYGYEEGWSAIDRARAFADQWAKRSV